MNILLVISQWPPSQTPNTLRWDPIIKEFISQGHQVSVLTTNRSGEEKLKIKSDHRVYRAGYNTLLDRLYDLRSSSHRRNELGKVPTSANTLGSVLNRIISGTWRANYWPDGSKLFIKPGLKEGKRIIVDDRITHLISVGLPFSAHLIGRQLKSENPELHWHMDIQDPFCYSSEFRVNNFKKYKKKNIDEERVAFEFADSISLTNERAKEKYVELFPREAKKARIIPPLFSEISSDKYQVFPSDNFTSLGYGGSFYEGVRSPKLFIDMINYIHEIDKESHEKFQIHLFGQLDKESYALFKKYHHLRPYFIFHGFVSRSMALSGLGKMDIIMNFGNTTDYHLPSKVVDYLYMNKPLINIVSAENDSTSNFLSDYPIERSDMNIAKIGIEIAAKKFLKIIGNIKGKLSKNIDMSEFLPQRIAQDYLDCLGGN